MHTPLVAISSPTPSPTAGDHAQGFLVAIALTVAGAVLTPFLAIAWVALQPALPVIAALRARSLAGAGVAAAGAGHRSAA